MNRLVLVVLLFVCSLCPAAIVSGQSRAPAGRTTRAQAGDRTGAAAEIAFARKALSDGRVEEAIAVAQPLFVADRSNREAAEVLIAGLAEKRESANALAAYDAFAATTRKTDAGLLRLIAHGELRGIVARRQAEDPVLACRALEPLARTGETEALQTLRREAGAQHGTSEESLACLVALARAGDGRAPATLAELLASASSWLEKVAVIKALKDAEARRQAAAVVALLDDPNPQVQAAAALGVAALDARSAVPRMEALFEKAPAIVQLYFAIAIKRLGSRSKDMVVAQALNSDVEQVRLAAGQAYETAVTDQWVPRVRELLANKDEMVRLQAADLLARRDPTARQVLVAALDNRDPLFRAEAARILESRKLLDATLCRRLLGDSYEEARVYGAAGALRLTAR